MKTVEFLLTLGTLLVLGLLLIWAFHKLLGAILNLIAIRNGDCPKHHGIVFNKETQQIEEDTSDVLPFD